MIKKRLRILYMAINILCAIVLSLGCSQAHMPSHSLVAGIRSDYQISINEDHSINEHANYNSVYSFDDWEGIKSVDYGIVNVGGLKDDGSVVVTGNNKTGACNVQDWSEIKALAFTAFTTYGLKSDGTIIHTDHQEQTDGIFSVDQNIINEVDKWSDIVDIKGAQFILAGIKKDGGVVVSAPTIPEFEEGVGKWRNIKQISVSMTMILGLTWEGEVLCVYDNLTNNYSPKDRLLQYKDLDGAKKVFAGQTYIAGLMPDGSLKIRIIELGHKDAEELMNLDALTNVKDANNYEEYLSILTNDGEILVAGYIE